MKLYSGGSRISCGGGVTDFRHGCFLKEMQAKIKELGPVGGRASVAPRGCANEIPHIWMYMNNLT